MSKFTQRTQRHFARIGSGTSLCLRYRLPQRAERLPGAQLSKEAKHRLKILDYARTTPWRRPVATSASPAPPAIAGSNATTPTGLPS